MKIAVPYENGQVFAHFGRAEHFKIYVVSDDEILSSEVVDTNGTGHSALAGFLQERGVNALICGGIGVGAVGELLEAKIQIMGGASGDADAQVTDFLNGKLHFETEGASCGHSCGHAADAEEECDGNILKCGHMSCHQ